MTECLLCNGPGPLRNSHILPEFVYRPTYDPTHTAVKIDTEKGRRGKQRKGFREYLLCSACEGKFGKWESYFADVWFNPARRLRPATTQEEVVRIPGLDYAAFKLFHMSVVWRAGVSTLAAFKNVKLGTQEPKLRRRLLESDPGTPTDYPFFGIALLDTTTGGFQDKLLKAPDAARVEGHWIYTLLFGGVLWHYYVSGHQTNRHVPVYFGLDGILTLVGQDWTKNAFVLDVAARIQRGKL